MKKHILKFIIKLFFFCLPIILLLSFYIIADPFRVLHHYDVYNIFAEKGYVVSNKDYISTETFLRNYPKYGYDSLIFGNSRSFFFQVKDWQNHINSKKCFHFDASNESLYGVHSKLSYLNQKNIPIKNVLMIIDKDILSKTTNSTGHLFIKHPRLSGQNRILFQLEFLKAFFDKQFLYEYFYFRLMGKIKKNIMDGGLLNDTPIKYDPIANEVRFSYYEYMINNNPKDYYLGRNPPFYKRSGFEMISLSIIKDDQKKLLNEIYSILAHNKTQYRIIIGPLYDQVKFNTKDFNFLSELFGKENIVNFSGKNKITNNIINYYDWSHYRPHVAKYILDITYK